MTQKREAEKATLARRVSWPAVPGVGPKWPAAAGKTAAVTRGAGAAVPGWGMGTLQQIVEETKDRPRGCSTPVGYTRGPTGSPGR